MALPPPPAVPMPQVPLEGQCSVVYNDTLYTYQPNAFQSLSLRDGSNWKLLPMGVSATGARCVVASLEGEDALFIVGGATNATEQDFPGLQRFMFANQTWQSASPQLSVTQNRQMHGAAYLNSTQSILVYAGFQDDSYTFSTQTFTISTSEPYYMKSFVSDAPPVMNPLVLPWNSSHAVMVGGSDSNYAVWIFSEATQWTLLNVTLPQIVPDISKAQAALVSLNDGSKILEIFDMSTSPNSLMNVLLQPPTGQTLTSREAKIWRTSLRSDRKALKTREEKDVSDPDYPSYNSTLAPSEVRSGFSLAQSTSGLVVISGGLDQSAGMPLCMFNETGNSWVDTQAFFSGQGSTGSLITEPSSSVSSSSPTSSTSAPASTSSAASSLATSSPTPVVTTSSTSSGSNTMTIVGATLGAVFGLAALLIIGFLVMRYVQRRNGSAGFRRRSSPYPEDIKHQIEFEDRTSPDGDPYGRNGQGSALAGNQQSKPFFHKPGDSTGSTKAFFGRKQAPVIMSPNGYTSADNPATSLPIAEAALQPVARTDTRADEGWSRYFGNAVDGPTIPPSEYGDQRSTRYTAGSQSDYTSDSRITSTVPRESAEVPPLNVPTQYTQPGLSIPRGYGAPTLASSGTIPQSLAEQEDFYNEGSSGQESWDPVGMSDQGSSWDVRPASSVYTESVYPHPGEKVRISQFPGAGDSRGMRTIASRDFAGGLSKNNGNGAQAGARGPSKPEGDMSWLNLGK